MSWRVWMGAGLLSAFLIGPSNAQKIEQLIGSEETTTLPRQINTGAGPTNVSVQQLATPGEQPTTALENITAEQSEKLPLEQPDGRDLCDPAYHSAAAKRAGLNCQSYLDVAPSASLRSDTEPENPDRRNEALQKSLRSLDLGDDVPPTFILQRQPRVSPTFGKRRFKTRLPPLWLFGLRTSDM